MGRIPLHLAAAGNHRQACKVLLAAARHTINAKDQVGLFCRVDNFIVKAQIMFTTLRIFQMGHTPLMMASACGVNTVRLLLGAGADATLTNTLGQTALHFAIANKRAKVRGCLQSFK